MASYKNNALFKGLSKWAAINYSIFCSKCPLVATFGSEWGSEDCSFLSNKTLSPSHICTVTASSITTEARRIAQYLNQSQTLGVLPTLKLGLHANETFGPEIIPDTRCAK